MGHDRFEITVDLSSSLKKKIAIGDVFYHPHIGHVRYIGPSKKDVLDIFHNQNEKYCELKKLSGFRQEIHWHTQWKDLYDLGFELEQP